MKPYRPDAPTGLTAGVESSFSHLAGSAEETPTAVTSDGDASRQGTRRRSPALLLRRFSSVNQSSGRDELMSAAGDPEGTSFSRISPGREEESVQSVTPTVTQPPYQRRQRARRDFSSTAVGEDTGDLGKAFLYLMSPKKPKIPPKNASVEGGISSKARAGLSPLKSLTSGATSAPDYSPVKPIKPEKSPPCASTKQQRHNPAVSLPSVPAAGKKCKSGHATATRGPETEIPQRCSNGLWSHAFAFPDQDTNSHDALADSSCEAVPKFSCRGIRGCKRGDCCSLLTGIQVLKQRQAQQDDMVVSGVNSSEAAVCIRKRLEQDILPYYDVNLGGWKEVPLPVSSATQIHVCVAAYCLIRGYSGATASRAIRHVSDGYVKRNEAIIRLSSGPARGLYKARAEEEIILKRYIHGLQFSKGECQPVPGAHHDKVTHLTRKSMKAKWNDCKSFFRESGVNPLPGDHSMFKRLWKEQTYIKEKTKLANAKCPICSNIDACLYKFSRPPRTDDNKYFLGLTQKKAEEHERDHLIDRAVLDDSAYLATIEPDMVWCLLVDAATQRNFQLPKYGFRTPKGMEKYPDWNFTLMGVYAFGYGFRPYIAHDSLKFGSNLTWTALWLTLCEMRDVRGRWPDILHLQMDNCSGDNKNFVTWAMAAWMVGSGKVKQVRIFFLQVGHTHIIIDQVFGVITTGLRRIELAVPEDLIENIRISLENNPQYKPQEPIWLHTTFDFFSWCEDDMGCLKPTNINSRTQANDEFGDYEGMYDFFVSKHEKKLAVMQYRERCRFPLRPEGQDGHQVIKRLPCKPPVLSKMNPKTQWAQKKSNSIESTIAAYENKLRSLKTPALKAEYRETWRKHIAHVKVLPELFLPEHQLTFRHFVTDLPRISLVTAGPAAPAAAESPPQPGRLSEEEINAWALRNLGMRSEPFAYDPVCGSEQSQAEYKKVRAEYEFQARKCEGALIARDAPVFLGDWVLARNPLGGPEKGVSLYAVDHLGPKGSTMYDFGHLRCANFSHTPNADVDGLWGEFKRQPFKELTPTHLTREQVLVFHAQAFQIVTPLTPTTKVTKTYLCVETLRCLSRVAPEEYPMPLHVPMTHVKDKDGGRAANAGNARAKNPKPGGRATNSTRPPAKRRRASSARASAASSSGSEEGSSESSSSHDSSGSVAGTNTSEEGSAASDSDELEEGSQETASAATPEIPAGVLLLDAPTLECTQGMFAFANMSDDEHLGGSDFPISPFYCEGSDGARPGYIWVRYFHGPMVIPTPGTTYDRRQNGKEVYKPKQYTYPKFWKDPKFKGGNLRHIERNTPAYLDSNWPKEELLAKLVLVLPVPQEYWPKKVMKVEGLNLPMSFMMDTLLPFARDNHIIA